MKGLIPAQRRKSISDFLLEHQIAPIGSLTDLLGVSEATVRRDLEWLEREGVLERTHGGARLTQRLPEEPDYLNSAQAHPEEKRLIGELAATLVKPGDCIFVNSGSTASQVIRHLHDVENLTIITNNVTAALEARSAKFELILLGGAFRSVARSVAGRFAVEMLHQMYASQAFIGVDGISGKHGCTTPNSSEAEIAWLMIERTRGDVVVVADHSKWGVVSNFEIAPLDRIHKLVSDAALDHEARDELAAYSIAVLPARPPLGSNGHST